MINITIKWPGTAVDRLKDFHLYGELTNKEKKSQRVHFLDRLACALLTAKEDVNAARILGLVCLDVLIFGAPLQLHLLAAKPTCLVSASF